MSLSRWRVALRVARREAERARGRSTLVVAMIMLPVAALAFAAVSYDTFELSAQERADRLMGAAQAAIVWPYDGPVEQDPLDLTTFWAPASASASEGGPRTLDGLLALLPPGTRAIPDQVGVLTVRTAAGSGGVGARMLDYADPLAHGILRQLEGRAPTSAEEIVLTPAAAQRLGVRVGGTVVMADGGRTFRVVGIVEDPIALASSTIVLRPDALPADAFAEKGKDVGSLVTWLVATPGPLTWADVRGLNKHGVVAVSRHVLAHPPAEAERYAGLVGGQGIALGVPVLVGGLALLEIILLAGPAFAVGARRRRRDLALVAAAGGTPAHLRRIVLADGVVLGAIAAASGVLLGILASAAGRPLIEEYVAHARSGAIRIFPSALAAIAGIAVITGVLAALVPAWVASRQDVVTALAGRRGITRSRRRWVVVGALALAAGACLAVVGAALVDSTTILAALAIAELGLVLCTPALVGLVARLGRFLPLGPRIALRDTSRNRTAAAPAISAVMAAVVGSLAAGVILTASSERTQDEYRSINRPGDVVLLRTGPKLAPDGPEAVPATAIDALRATMPVQQVYEIGLPVCGPGECIVSPRVPPTQACPYAPEVLRRDPTPDEQRAARRDAHCDDYFPLVNYFNQIAGSGFTVIVDESALGVVTNLPADDVNEAAAALRAGKVIVDHPRYVDGDRVTLAMTAVQGEPGTQKYDGTTRSVTAPAFVLPHRPQAPIVIMSKATARSLGLDSVTAMTWATTSRMPTVAERDRLQAMLGHEAGVYVEQGPPADSSTRSLLALAIVAGVISLSAAAVATGLAAADGRAELGTLAAVGASPGVRRQLSLSQSGVIAGLGSLIGTVAGLGAGIAVLAAINRGYADVWPTPTPYPITVPWLNVGVALVAVPAVAMLGAGLLTRARLPIERRS